MLRNISKAVAAAVILFLLVTLSPFSLQAEAEAEVEVEEGVSIVSHTKTPGIGFIFEAQTNYSGINLYLADPNGQVQQLTHTNFANSPSLSPDGKSVFFEDTAQSESGRHIYQIFKLDLDSRKITQISDGSVLDSVPRCAPDGKHLAFCSQVADPNIRAPWLIYTMDIDGKNRQPLDAQSTTNQLTPSWSPDSTKIVFINTSMLPLEGFYPLAFPIATPKIRDIKKGTTTNLLPGGFAANDTAWAPSGDRIAFRNHDPVKDVKTIWIVTMDGLKLEKVTDGLNDAQPSWFPDGTKLAFVRLKEGKKRVICMVDLKTREVTELFSSKDASLEQPRVMYIKSLRAGEKALEKMPSAKEVGYKPVAEQSGNN